MQHESTIALKKILLAIALILALAIAFFLGRASAPTTGADPASTSASTESNQTVQNAETQAARPQFASSQEQPEVLELLRSQPRREDGDPRALGSVDAPVVMVAFEDFSCPMCTVFFSNVYPSLKPLVEDGTLRIEFHDLTIFPNYGSDKAARGSRAAANQGKFWEFTETAYKEAGAGNHPTYDDARVLEIAKTIGVANLEQFQADYSSDETAALVQAETEHAIKNLGVTGTPFFIVNDAAISGAQPVEYFLKTIENQLSEAK